jgi:hypothetical protein
MEGKEYLIDIGADGRIILEWILRLMIMDWTLLAQDRNQCCTYVNTVMNLGVP